MDSLTIMFIGLSITIALYYLIRIAYRVGYLSAMKDVVGTVSSMHADKQKAVEGAEPMRVDFQGDMIFLYSEKTDEFLAQGKTMAELGEIMFKRFPNRMYSIRKEDMQKIIEKEKAHGKSV